MMWEEWAVVALFVTCLGLAILAGYKLYLECDLMGGVFINGICFNLQAPKL